MYMLLFFFFKNINLFRIVSKTYFFYVFIFIFISLIKHAYSRYEEINILKLNYTLTKIKYFS